MHPVKMTAICFAQRKLQEMTGFGKDLDRESFSNRFVQKDYI